MRCGRAYPLARLDEDQENNGPPSLDDLEKRLDIGDPNLLPRPTIPPSAAEVEAALPKEPPPAPQ